MTSFLTEKELAELGLKRLGKNVKISRNARIYGAENVSVGDNVRIDDFCVLSGVISLGNNVHIAVYSALFGGEAGITVDDFANISSRVCIYAVSDDYSGRTMTNPTVPDKYKAVQKEPVTIGKHAIIGSGSTVLPGVVIAEGTAVGAMSLCKKSTEPWKIYAGIPAKIVKDRKKDLLSLEKEYINERD